MSLAISNPLPAVPGHWHGLSVRTRLRLLLLGLLCLMCCTAYLGYLITSDRNKEQAMHANMRSMLSSLADINRAQEGLVFVRQDLLSGLTAANIQTHNGQPAFDAINLATDRLNTRVTPVKAIDPLTGNAVTSAANEAAGNLRRAVALAATGDDSLFAIVIPRLPATFADAESKLRLLQTRLQQNLSGLLDQRDSVRRDQTLLTGFAIFVLAMIAVTSGVLVMRSVITPLARIHNALEKMGRGERLTANPNDDGRVDEFTRISNALTELSDTTAHLNRVAYFDVLTSLPNRARFESDITDRLADGHPFTLIQCDLDHFRTVNDGYSHSFGDLYLKMAAGRLKAVLADQGVVYRFSGGMFVMIVPLAKNLTETRTFAFSIAESMRAALSVLGPISDKQMSQCASFGVAMFPEDAESVDTLISAADAAMFQAKRLGRNNVQFARRDMTQKARRQLELAEELRIAIPRGEITPYFQPIIDLALGEVICAESLARWKHPTRGFVPPDEFIAVAESSGQLDALTDRLLRSACTTAAGWHFSGTPRKLAFNLSAKQVRDGVVEMIQVILFETGLPAHLLEIEITEGAIIERPEAAERLLTDLKKLGISIALDDFGTGYSSLSYLLRFPIDKIKVDKSFVHQLEGQRTASKIVAATIALAQSLDMCLVAEGVEQLSQMLTLYELGCRSQQGWLFCKALPPAEFDAWAKNAPLRLDAIVRAQMQTNERSISGVAASAVQC